MPRKPRVAGIRHVATIVATVTAVLIIAAAEGRADGQLPFNIDATEVPAPTSSGQGGAAILAAQRGDWSEAQTLADQAGDPVAAKLVFWLKAASPDTVISFPELADFIANNPDWPGQTMLRKRAEDVLKDGYAPDYVAAWFKRYPPLTTDGDMAYAAALSALGQTDNLRAVVRDAWINGTFSDSDEAQFLAAYGTLLTPEDDARRVDRLLWEGNTQAAQRIFDRLGTDEQALAGARLRLKRKQITPEAAAARVPEAMRDQPGLVFDEVQWYRRNDQPLMARSRLLEAPPDPAHAGRFWDERSLLARQALADGDATTAYRLAAAHGPLDGADLAEAEWFAGWVALRYLADPSAAFPHFVRIAETSSMPISVARGAYWAARAREASGQPDEAGKWYQRAAQYPTTFYGQLGAAARAPGQPLPLPSDPLASAEDRAAFERNELKRAADMLAAVGSNSFFRTFVLQLSKEQSTPGGRYLAAAYAQNSGRLEVGVAVAKQAVRDGQTLISGGYPTLAWIDGDTDSAIEVPLLLSIVRQESQFNASAISPAGARGLMQLMPGTAREIAAKLSVPYETETLTLNPNYNLQLGEAYIRRLLDTFSGSYVFTLAAYNAGPRRVQQWLQDFGDPRGDLLSTIDWIEKIPFAETRNYVQRTMENIHVYRNRIDGPSVPLVVVRDLVR